MPLGGVWRGFALGLGIFISLVWCTDSLALSEKEKAAQSMTHYLMGLIYDWQNKPQKALEEYQEAQAIDGASYAIHLRLGADYARTGKLNEAIAEFKTASQLNPQGLDSHYFLALVYTYMQNKEAANQEYEIILKSFSDSDPQNAQVKLFLGQLYLQQKRFDESIKQFQEILKLDSKNIDALFFLGSLFEQKGQEEQAVKYFKDILSLDPKHSASLNSLGYLYAQQGKNLDEAERLVKLALELEPDNGAYIDSLGWVYFKKFLKSNDYKLLAEAIKELGRASSLLVDPEILGHLAEAYFRSGDKEKAKGLWHKSLELDPTQKALKERLEQVESQK